MDFLSKLFKTPSKNGNLCERGQGSPLEAIAPKSFNADPVNTPAKQPPAVEEKTQQSSTEEDQSQALTDTNSASFVSLNTLSASEAVFSTATGDQSRPISAGNSNTDSLDYESADEAVSLRADEQQENGTLHDESLGLDALANKLSSLYINSPNPPKKPPAFHSEDATTPTAQPQLDESDSDISFNASFVEVIGHENQTGEQEDQKQEEDSQEQVVEEKTLIVEEISEPEELSEVVEKLSEPALEEEKQPEPVPALEEEKQVELSVEATNQLESEEQPSVAEEKVEEVKSEEVLVVEEESPIVAKTEVKACEVPLPDDTEPSSAEPSPKEKEPPVVQTEATEIQAAAIPSEEKPQECQIKSLAEIAEAFIQNSPEKEHTEAEAEQEIVPVAELEAPKEAPVEEKEENKEPLEEPSKQEATETPVSEEAAEATPEESRIPEKAAVLEEKQPTKEESSVIEAPVVEEAPEQPLEEPQNPQPVADIQESDPALQEGNAAQGQQIEFPVEPEKQTAEPECVAAPQTAEESKEEVQPEQPEEKVESQVPALAEEVPEPIAEVSFEEPTLIIPEVQPVEPSQVLVKVIEPVKEDQIAPEISSTIYKDIPKEDQNPTLDQVKEVDKPEKEVSEEKPVVERKIAPATLFIQQRRGNSTPQRDALITSTGSLSELLDLCEKQQKNLEDEVDTQVLEETNELEQLLAADADLICQELNASLDAINVEMSDNEAPVTPPRRSRSPRKPSPGRNSDLEDPFKPKSRIGISPARGVEANSVSMSSSSESALVSSRMSMSKSTDSASPKFMRSMDSGIAGAEINHSEAGPEIASQDEQFVPATEELFKDPSAFDFLSKFGGNDSTASRLERESLYVKFDPLVGNRDRRVFLSPCIEASPRSEETAETPIALSKRAAKAETPLTSRHAVGPLVQIATPVNEEQVAETKPEPASKENNQKEAEMEALQQMIMLQKQESEQLKKLMTSQVEDYEQNISALQGKLKQKTEAEEQMSLVMKEYEDTISRILAEKEKAMEKAQEDKQKLTDELAIIQSDLSAAEVAFSDLHRKYERAKSAIEVFKANENTLKQSNLQFQEQIKQAEKKYLVLKAHAEDKLEEAAKENEALVKNSELELSALKAQNAQLKARNTTLVETLGMRERENQELMTICDDLVQKLGTQNH